MQKMRLFQCLILFIISIPCIANVVNNESDAMQITTHFNNLTGISCDSTAQYCVAVGSAIHQAKIDHIVYTTHDGGITWEQTSTLLHPEQEDSKMDIDPLSKGYVFTTIRCDSTGSHCLIAGSTSVAGQSTLFTYTSHDNGKHWSQPTLIRFSDQHDPERRFVDDYPFLRLKCNPSGSQCILAANTISHQHHTPVFLTTSDLGETWSELSVLDTPSSASYGVDLLDLDCDQSGLICTAVTSTQTDAADDAEERILPPQMGLIYSTHDGGTTWSDAKSLMISRNNSNDPLCAPDDILSLINCDQSGLTCTALGTHYTVKREKNSIEILENPSHAYLTKNGGLSWQDTNEIISDKGHSLAFTALDCDTSNRFCAAVGIEFNENNDDQFHPVIHTSTDSGQTWHKKSFSPPENAISLMLDVFCSEDAAFCHTVGFYLQNMNSFNKR